MQAIAGRSLGAISAAPPTSRRDDGPANPARLAALVKVANAIGLRHLGLDMPRIKCMACARCSYQTVCRARGELGLWAPCEQPYESDLFTLANVLEDHMSEEKRTVSLGERLKALREQHGFNWNQLARRIGTGGGSVKNWENGNIPAMSSLIALAWAYDTTPEMILAGVEITSEIARRYRAFFEQEYSGQFTLTVKVTVAGADRAEIVSEARRALRRAGAEFAKVPRIEALPEKLEVALGEEAA
jgi:transcriptional regulator with XRE-family HTH domain